MHLSEEGSSINKRFEGYKINLRYISSIFGGTSGDNNAILWKF